MAHTGVVINQESWAILREEPLYSARFIDRESTEELALVIRVEALDFFLCVYPPLTLDLTTWCSSHGTWVVAIAYQLHPTFGDTQAGVFYLNPRQAADAQILCKLPRQDTLSVIFLSEDCNEHYTVGVVQDPQNLARWQQLIADMNQSLVGEKLVGDFDPDFEKAVQELQAGQ